MLKEILIITSCDPPIVTDEYYRVLIVGKWRVGKYGKEFAVSPADFYSAAELELSKTMLKKVDEKNPGK
jgi:hypothetical protein